MNRLPDSSWLAFEVMFTLETPWYSKDDRPFHVLDNPLRKDRVFGVPYLAAASWKGLLRWACRMQAGLHDYLGQHGGKLDGWQDPAWIVHLFGNEKGEAEDFERGALAFYPTWFDKIGFEIINPHSRRTRAGTKPIAYEVVPAGTEGTLHLLYAPLPGAATRDKVKSEEAIERLLEATQALLTTYGMSAKRTAGWGTAGVSRWTAHRRGQTPISENSLADFKIKIKPWANAEAQGG
ncbi:MAG TPA: RAMP superfamily CRISPR-associated protein [Chloroflexota bacterium]|nr:RAMP superfamily CRISPR-associated protein [Chloroflexota bacterium]